MKINDLRGRVAHRTCLFCSGGYFLLCAWGAPGPPKHLFGVRLACAETRPGLDHDRDEIGLAKIGVDLDRALSRLYLDLTWTGLDVYLDWAWTGLDKT